MHSLALTLLLVFMPAADGAESRSPTMPEFRARRLVAPEAASIDPCELAREIARQPACLASGSCESLQLWQRTFGRPRFAPLDPGRPARASLAVERLPGGRRGAAAPRVSRLPNPGAFCTAAADPRP